MNAPNLEYISLAKINARILKAKMSEIKTLIGPHNEKIAYVKECQSHSALSLVWLCGYHSDMSGSKAETMAKTAKENSINSVRFDYSGHGQSDGKFEDGTIGKWLSEAQFVLDNLIDGDAILIGSSMGGWISLLLALQNQHRIKGLVLSAPAPDFTEDLMWNNFTDEQKKQLNETGYWLRPNDYDAPYKVTKDLIFEGRNHLLLGGEINLQMPIHIIHGMEDKDVPFMRSINLAQKLKSQNIELQLIKNGGHRLSEPNELLILKSAINKIYHATL